MVKPGEATKIKEKYKCLSMEEIQKKKEKSECKSERIKNKKSNYFKNIHGVKKQRCV